MMKQIAGGNLLDLKENAIKVLASCDFNNRFVEIFQQALTFSSDIQEEMVGQWLEDIKDEMNWQKTLLHPQEKLSQLAIEALQKSVRGETITKGFDEI